MDTHPIYQARLAEVVASGLTQAEVSRRLGITKSAVNEAIRSPAWVPSHPVGERLLALHAERLRASGG